MIKSSSNGEKVTEMVIDPIKCAKKILDIHGQKGVKWLSALPELVEECARRWSLIVLPPFDYDSYSYVCPAIREGGENVVLKLGVPHPEITSQVEMLRICKGEGMVHLLDADPGKGVILMERALPGTMLAGLEDDAMMTEIAARLMLRQWPAAPPCHNFPLVAGWAADLNKIDTLFEDGYGPFSHYLIDKARHLFKDLLVRDEEPRLIHGDANPFNILQAEREPWLFIDPKGAVGSLLYDVAVFLNNLPEDRTLSEKRRMLERRVRQFAEILGVEREKIRDWGQAQCVLSGFWTFEELGVGWESTFAIAELYDGLRDL
jgi:streptomycin 6-kinase